MRLAARLIEKAKRQGEAYTALDAMKLFAIVNMTIDHIGAYLFPEVEWLRAIGRITFPVWFFLVGYSTSRGYGKSLWMYALALMGLQPFVGYPMCALNALVTVILCRWVLNLCTDYRLIPKRIPELIALCVMLSPVTISLFEYGSIAFLYALLGRMVRLGEKKHLAALALCAYLLFVAWQLVLFKFDLFQQAYVVAGTAWVVYWLARCPNNVVWPNWQESRAKTFLTVLSRNTLPYYFYHRALFQIIGMWWLGKEILWQWFR